MKLFLAAILVLTFSIQGFGDELEIEVGGKKFKAKPIEDLVSFPGLTVTDPPLDPKEVSIPIAQNKLAFQPIVSCEFTRNSRVFKRVSLSIHPDDAAQAEKDFAAPKDRVYEYRALIKDDGNLIAGDEKTVQVLYPGARAVASPADDHQPIANPGRRDPADRKVVRLQAMLYFGGEFKWWMRVEGEGALGYLVTTKPNGVESVASKVKCKMGGVSRLSIAP